MHHDTVHSNFPDRLSSAVCGLPYLWEHEAGIWIKQQLHKIDAELLAQSQ